MKSTTSSHEDRITSVARAAFRGFKPDQEAVRAAAIDALSRVEWHGRTLYTITCRGGSGRGPHPVNVPESLLWQLIDLGYFRCPYHR